MTKLTWESFLKEYFNATEQNGRYYNPSGELLNLRIAADFYEEYVNSNYSIEEYIKRTQSDVE